MWLTTHVSLRAAQRRQHLSCSWNPSSGKDGAVRAVLTTERLILRQLTDDDVDNLVELDSDPAVLRYINGGTPTPRAVIQDEILPRFMEYYDRGHGFGFWAAIE